MSSNDAFTPPPPDNRLFTITVVLSVLVHALTIGLLRFGDIDPRTLFNSAPLDIVLVNAHSTRAPLKAEQLAQANLEGGGNTDLANRHIKTPLPAQQLLDASSELSQSSQQVLNEEARQSRLLSQLNDASRLIADAAKPESQPNKGVNPDAQKRQASEILRQEGEIAREIEAYQSKPHKAFVGARTKGVVEAQYVDGWRSKIERVGTLNYPSDGRGQRLTGRLMVTVEIRADGTLAAVEINRSSGNKELDEAAIRIVKQSAPFPRLPAGIVDAAGKPADILAITRAWTFARGDNQLGVVPEGTR
ncbi:energy transducer TonB [Chitinimonas sp.]|uniref:energy transducer TonB n=1 Tax=Chitinimonas sp. TaxID=1934313 RepID=UPI0035B16FF8